MRERERETERNRKRERERERDRVHAYIHTGFSLEKGVFIGFRAGQIWSGRHYYQIDSFKNQLCTLAYITSWLFQWKKEGEYRD